METHSHKRIYKLCGSPVWKHTLTQEDIGLQALWESSMESHINTQGYTSSVGVQHGNKIFRQGGRGYTSFVGVQHGNTQALWESSMETHIHTRGYTNYAEVQHRNTHSQ